MRWSMRWTFSAWLERRRRERELIDNDATAFIERFGEAAYDRARDWVIGELAYKVVDQDRPAGHWQKVRAEIRRRIGATPKTDTATRYLEDR